MANAKKPLAPLRPETLMMSHGYDPFLSEGAVKPPVFLTSTFAFRTAEDGAEYFDALRAAESDNSGLIYSRFNHPNLQIAEERLAVYEQGETSAVFSSGMSAIATTLLALVSSNEVILRSQPLYGGTETLITNVLAKQNIRSECFIDGLNAQDINHAAERAMKSGRVSLIFLETPSNPTNTLIDFALIGDVADRIEKHQNHRPIIVCDNTLLGPVFQSPLNHGVDLVLYSLTKYIGGHSDLVAGAVIGNKTIVDQIRAARSAFGTQLDPHSCWMIGRSLETVGLRMQRACDSAIKLAAFLHTHPKVAKLHHPSHAQNASYQATYDRQCSGPGSTFSFDLSGGREMAFRFLNGLQIFKLAVSLGGTESLACHPRSTTHSSVPAALLDELEVSDALVRTSIGLEHPDDLINDLEQALATC
ncbi:MAG: cystathionine gamma-synthase family protein [Gammaproteobacteria bacterium]